MANKPPRRSDTTDFDYNRDKMGEGESRRPIQPQSVKNETGYRQGDLVTLYVDDMQREGTVSFCSGKDVYIMTADGVIHCRRAHEIHLPIK